MRILMMVISRSGIHGIDVRMCTRFRKLYNNTLFLVYTRVLCTLCRVQAQRARFLITVALRRILEESLHKLFKKK